MNTPSSAMDSNGKGPGYMMFGKKKFSSLQQSLVSQLSECLTGYESELRDPIIKLAHEVESLDKRKVYHSSKKEQLLSEHKRVVAL